MYYTITYTFEILRKPHHARINDDIMCPRIVNSDAITFSRIISKNFKHPVLPSFLYQQAFKIFFILALTQPQYNYTVFSNSFPVFFINPSFISCVHHDKSSFTFLAHLSKRKLPRSHAACNSLLVKLFTSVCFNSRKHHTLLEVHFAGVLLQGNHTIFRF